MIKNKHVAQRNSKKLKRNTSQQNVQTWVAKIHLLLTQYCYLLMH